MFGHMGGSFNPGNGYGFGNGAYGYGPGNFGYGHGFGMMSGFNFTGILLMIVIGFVIYLLIKRSRQNQVGQGQNLVNLASGQATPSEGVEIAKLRYARGEISFDEFEEIVKVLNS